MNKNNALKLIPVIAFLVIMSIVFLAGWWLLGITMIAGGGFILYRISGSNIGLTQLGLLKKIPSNKSWWVYGLVTLSTLYFILLGFGVIKWGWVQFNVTVMLSIIALSAILSGSKDISESLQRVMKLWFRLSIVGIVVLILATRFIPDLTKKLDYSYLSKPTAPVEEVAPPAEEVPPPSTERVVVSGKKITLRGDGTYSLPKGKKSLCFTNLGMKDGTSTKSQYLTLNGVEYISLGTECHALPEDLEGEVVVDFFPGKKWGTTSEVKRLYAYWKSQPGGQSEWPIIRIGE